MKPKVKYSPVSIEDVKITAPLTTAQIYLMELLSKKIKASSPITFDDVSEIYTKWIVIPQHSVVGRGRSPVYRKGKLTVYTLFKKHPADRHYTWDYLPIKEYHKTERYSIYCRQWFANNLGALVLKGRLLVIPLIDKKLMLE